MSSILKAETKTFLKNVKNNFKFSNNLKDDVIMKNINYDYSKKIVLESLLGNYREYILSDPNDINFIYNYKIKYITLSTDKQLPKEILQKINKIKNTKELLILLKTKFEFYIQEKDIKNLKKISNKIQILINSDNKIHIEKNNSFYQIIIVEKNLEYNQGIFYNLTNYETENQLSNDKENCNYIKNLNNIKSSKEYELSKLNENIKNNLKNINDF